MIVNKLELKQALNKTYLKIKPDTENVKEFKANLGRMLDLCDSKKDEEFNKNLLSDFLKKSFYGDRYFINTKENSDLVIHNDKGADSAVGVIFETKKPTKTNSVEMPKVDNLNRKAFQQLVLYFLRERVTHGNVAVKHLVVTNIYEWFIFDAKLFEELFFSDKDLVKNFQDFEEGRLSGHKTDFFYKQIAEPAIAKVIDRLKFTHFDLQTYEGKGLKPLVSGEGDLIELYKIFSPEHLLKLPFANDSNSLNKPFYNELLYIIGLVEIKDKGKKLIGRMAEGDRLDGSLIENAISRLDSLDKVSQLKKPEEFGETYEDRIFNVALRLSINWINRILFLKLLEAQLIKYHQGDRDFAFLNLAKVQNYDDLDSLFFDVLAREQDRREAKVKEAFANVPYLNSSLFEPTETEQQTIVISNLKDRNLPIFSGTVLKDGNGNRRSGELNALAYLFEFLDAYKFDRDELEDTQEDSEKLINASVLGLIFEKINGYKDGSFYTPSSITMYMCRETIRRAVVQKFNEVKGWSCQNLDDLYERIEDKKEANAIINSLKICDPAVGSGHFLVSALNEMIAIKSELRVLLDRSGKSLKDYRVEVRNDKLLVYDDEGKLFAYHPNNVEKQRVQEALFHEKQTIIESCLFGVDINPNSVTICRLRLWIELLKNAYYRVDPPQASIGIDPPQPPLKRGENINASFPPFLRGVRGDLETLPNIDINIKCGNSLISRFGLDVDVKQVLKKQKFSIEQYRNAVQTYRSAESKAQKREMEGLIAKIKNGFSVYLGDYTPDKKNLLKLQQELAEKEYPLLFESETDKKAREKKISKLHNEIDKLEAKISDIESGRLYENALEWRFEFPEVLNDDGDFVGFDVVIGNPPYALVGSDKIGEQQYFKNKFQMTSYKINVYLLFVEKGLNLLGKLGSQLSYIIPKSLVFNTYFAEPRRLIMSHYAVSRITEIDEKVFEDAEVGDSIIFSAYKSESPLKNNLVYERVQASNSFEILDSHINSQEDLLRTSEANFYISSLISLRVSTYLLKDIADVSNGLNSGNVRHILFTSEKLTEKHQKLLLGKDIKNYSISWSGTWVNYDPNLKNTLTVNDIKSKDGMNAQNKVDFALRKKEIFHGDKILIRKTADSIIAAYDKDSYYFDSLAYGIKVKSSIDISIFYILGLLNSTLINWFHNNLSNNKGKIFAKVLKENLDKLPIAYEGTEKFKTSQEEIVNLVDEILTAKKGDPNADTSELEKECDRLVYKLYQLTYDEVKIIDPEFELTEQEYTAIKTG